MSQKASSQTTNERSGKQLLTIVFKFIVILVILGCGIALAAYYLNTGPKAQPRKEQVNPPLVKVEQLSFQDHQLIIESMGTIIAAREVNLTPGISGEIIEVNQDLVPGGSVALGETLIGLDPIDYKLAVLELQNEVDIASYELDLEMGSQRIAQKEFEILGQTVSASEKALILREPQLKMKQASLKNKEARLAQAQLNLSRTFVTAPFNSIVISTSVNLGSRVSQSTPVAQLVGTDEFWVKMLLPVDKLQWLLFPEENRKNGSSVHIFLESKIGSPYRVGRLSKLSANLEEKGKLAIVYAVVKDPLCLLPENVNKPRLLLGSFVRVEIEGFTFKNVLVIDRNHLRENNSIWIMDEENRLDIRPVEIIARNKNQILIRDSFKSGERLITSALSAPVEGTELQLLGEKEVARPKPADSAIRAPKKQSESMD